MSFFTRTEGPIEQKPQRVWNKSAGWQTVRSWKGSHRAIEGLVPSVQEVADLIELNYDGAVAELRATFGNAQDQSQEQPQSLWELIGNDVEYDLHTHPAFSGISYEELVLIEQNITNELPSHKSGEITTDNQGTRLEVATSETGTKLFQFLRRKTTSYLKSQFVLRHSLTFSSAFNYAPDVAPGFNGVEKVWTTEQMISYHPDIPQTLRVSIEQIAAPSPQQNYVWGWLKKTGTIQEVSGGRFQFNQEWWLDQWAILLYPAMVL